LPRARCALTPPFHPYRQFTPVAGARRRRRSSPCCTLLGVAATGRYPASCSVELGLSSRLAEALAGDRPSGVDAGNVHRGPADRNPPGELRRAPPRVRGLFAKNARAVTNGTTTSPYRPAPYTTAWVAAVAAMTAAVIGTTAGPRVAARHPISATMTGIAR